MYAASGVSEVCHRCVCVCVREFRLAAFTADLRDAMYPVVKHKLH